jgi:MerR family transcriptional regulator/heat shock protein HspR
MVRPPWADPGRGLFSISVAAELTGLHPHTLRLYDHEGLLAPARSPGGARRYSPDDIDRLQQITALTSDGVNLAGVRRILQLQEQARRGRGRRGPRAAPSSRTCSRNGQVGDQDDVAVAFEPGLRLPVPMPRATGLHVRRRQDAR